MTPLELACETDFVAKNERFIALADKVVDAAAAAGADSVEAALAADADGKTVEQLISDEAAIIGERSSSVACAPSRATSSRSTCTRQARTCPRRSAWSSPTRATTPRPLARSRSTSRSRTPRTSPVTPCPRQTSRRSARSSPRSRATRVKPEAALPKIVEGRVNAFFKQVSLLDQDYAKDNKLSPSKGRVRRGLTLTDFARFKVGA